MDKESLTWEITPEEQRERNRRVILALLSFLPLILALIIVEAFSEAFSLGVELSLKIFLSSVFFTTLLIVGIILLLLVANRIFLYQRRTYYLNNQGITISKGKKKKYYYWDDFECFYRYSIGGFRTDSSLDAGSKTIQGEIFYLKMKPKGFLSRFYKVFVVVYSEPDNSEVVEEFLNRYLSQKRMKPSVDLGLVFYKFK